MKIIVIGTNPEQVRGYDHESWEDEVSWEDYAMWGLTVNEVYDDADSFLATLPVTPVEQYEVVVVGDTVVPPTNDPYWGAYDENWLVVTVQSANKIYYYNNTMNLSIGMRV